MSYEETYRDIAKQMLDMMDRRNFVRMLFTFALSEAAKQDDANVLHNTLQRIVEVNKRYMNVDFEIETETLAAALPGQFSAGMWRILNVLAVNEIYECLKDRDGHLVANCEIWKYSPRTMAREWRGFYAKAKAERHERLSSLIDPNKRFEALARVVAMIPPEFDISQVEHVDRSA